MAGAILVLVAVLALVVNPPAPPGIAAFAPQAAKPITKAPEGQEATSGEGPGACGAGRDCAAASPEASGSAAPSPTAVAAASPKALTGAAPPGLQCYSWPDGSVTQTFDPQSPTCIARWDDSKGNGGATSPGVTGQEIRVALPVVGTNSTWPGMKPIVDFVNSRFQFYGRKITIVPVPSQQVEQTATGEWNDPAAQRADAAAISAEKVFATFDFLDPVSQSWTLPVFLDAMAKSRIVSINGGDVTPYGTAADLRKRSPYAWSYYPTIDQVMTSSASMICRQLAGRPADHAPDPALQKTPRKLALLFPTDEKMGGPVPGLAAMQQTLAGCGFPSAKLVRWQSGTQNGPAMSAAMQELRNDGVTSLVYLPFGGSGTANSPMATAQRVGFRPEWVLVGWNNYNAAFLLKDPPSQTSGAFGIGAWNKQPQLAGEPFHQAFVAAGGDPATTNLQAARGFYQELMLLASGIQLAGPRLTPETFAEGLRTPNFPNPGAGGAPHFQGTVGFDDGDSVMVDDYTAFWLDTRTSGTDVQTSRGINQHKAMCVVELGRRWRLDAWPQRDGFYKGQCR